jgi:hypothetical protein
MDIANNDLNLSYVMFWRVSYKQDRVHFMTHIVHQEMFFRTKESVEKYIESVPERERYQYQVTEVLALKQSRVGQTPRYFPLEKPIIFSDF